MSLTLKLYIERLGCTTEIRRFIIKSDSADIYNETTTKIKQVFPSLASANFTLFWRDAEGDRVAFSTSEEMKDAINNIDDGILRLYVVIQSRNTGEIDDLNKPLKKHLEKQQPADKPQQQPADKKKHSTDKKRHPSDKQPNDAGQNFESNDGQGSYSFSFGAVPPVLTCSECKHSIDGIFHKCCECFGYNLCQNCASKGLHSEHTMLRLDHPQVISSTQTEQKIIYSPHGSPHVSFSSHGGQNFPFSPQSTQQFTFEPNRRKQFNFPSKGSQQFPFPPQGAQHFPFPPQGAQKFSFPPHGAQQFPFPPQGAQQFPFPSQSSQQFTFSPRASEGTHLYASPPFQDPLSFSFHDFGTGTSFPQGTHTRSRCFCSACSKMNTDPDYKCCHNNNQTHNRSEKTSFRNNFGTTNISSTPFGMKVTCDVRGTSDNENQENYQQSWWDTLANCPLWAGAQQGQTAGTAEAEKTNYKSKTKSFKSGSSAHPEQDTYKAGEHCNQPDDIIHFQIPSPFAIPLPFPSKISVSVTNPEPQPTTPSSNAPLSAAPTPNVNSTSSAPTAKNEPKANNPDSSKIQESLDLMLGMGFSDSNNILKVLLMENNGDIGATIDALKVKATEKKDY